MYKYSAFKINRKYFRSSMSKNFSSFPAPTGDLFESKKTTGPLEYSNSSNICIITKYW